MCERIKFKTLAELQDKYPVGSVLNKRFHAWVNTEYYYNDTDLKILKQRYDSVYVIDDNTCNCSKKEIYLDIVEGYLYDGEYWYPAHQTHDGWIEYDEYDLKKE